MCESRPTWLADSMASVRALRDGTRVLIRPLLYSDRQELALRYRQLSPESRRLRFFMPPSELASRELDYLTNLDYDRHFAWAAFAIEEPGWPGIGVARYIREETDPQRAEAAVTVLDAYQGKGLGTLLLVLLAETASAKGVLTFVLHVLWENIGVVEPLRELGARIEAEEPGVARIEVDLPATPPTPSEGFVRRLLAAIATVLRVPRSHPASSPQ